VSDRLDELGADTSVVLVTFTKPERLDTYRANNHLPFPILIDDERVAYRTYGLGRGSLARMYGRKAARKYMELFKKNGLAGLAKPVEDTQQLGGDFVIGPDGVLRYGFWGEGPDDRPSVDDLITAVGNTRE
jgi:peroxiredoxin